MGVSRVCCHTFSLKIIVAILMSRVRVPRSLAGLAKIVKQHFLAERKLRPKFDTERKKEMSVFFPPIIQPRKTCHFVPGQSEEYFIIAKRAADTYREEGYNRGVNT